MKYVSSKDFKKVVSLLNETHKPSVEEYKTPREAFMEIADSYKVANIEGQPSFFLFCAIGPDREAWMVECNRVGNISKAYQITEITKDYDELEQLIRDTCYGRVDTSEEFLSYYDLPVSLNEDESIDIKLWQMHSYREDAKNTPDDAFIKDSNGNDMIFESIYAAEYYIDDLCDQQYTLKHGELSRPEYKIVF
ncbi:MAG: hypothetical protein J6N72_02880 [Psychrobacter sp.]|nr:hypothetical protein [Psychrobacter sp.]